MLSSANVRQNQQNVWQLPVENPVLCFIPCPFVTENRLCNSAACLQVGDASILNGVMWQYGTTTTSTANDVILAYGNKTPLTIYSVSTNSAQLPTGTYTIYLAGGNIPNPTTRPITVGERTFFLHTAMAVAVNCDVCLLVCMHYCCNALHLRQYRAACSRLRPGLYWQHYCSRSGCSAPGKPRVQASACWLSPTTLNTKEASVLRMLSCAVQMLLA